MMLSPRNSQKFTTLITELRILADHARSRANLPTPSDDLLPEYWLGVAKGYDDAIERIELLLQKLPSGN